MCNCVRAWRASTASHFIDPLKQQLILAGSARVRTSVDVSDLNFLRVLPEKKQKKRKKKKANMVMIVQLISM